MDSTVREQIMKVRATGKTNMFDVNAVMRIAFDEGYYELVNYLQDHRKEYSNFILYGKTS